jgi:hypothetical protein
MKSRTPEPGLVAPGEGAGHTCNYLTGPDSISGRTPKRASTHTSRSWPNETRGKRGDELADMIEAWDRGPTPHHTPAAARGALKRDHA